MKKLLCASTLVIAACGSSQAFAAKPSAPTTASKPAVAAQNGTRVSLSGKIASTTTNAFQLDIGEDVISVEMDDWDWFKEGKALKPGDDVIVMGRVDKDLWERKKIEASSVFVRNLGTTFYASGADEEDLAAALVLVDPVSSAMGSVTAVEGSEFTVGTAIGPVRVDLSRLKVRPALKVGDRIHAWGQLDIDRREMVELMADGVVVLTVDRSKRL